MGMRSFRRSAGSWPAPIATAEATWTKLATEIMLIEKAMLNRAGFFGAGGCERAESKKRRHAAQSARSNPIDFC